MLLNSAVCAEERESSLSSVGSGYRMGPIRNRRRRGTLDAGGCSMNAATGPCPQHARPYFPGHLNGAPQRPDPSKAHAPMTDDPDARRHLALCHRHEQSANLRQPGLCRLEVRVTATKYQPARPLRAHTDSRRRPVVGCSALPYRVLRTASANCPFY